MSENDSVGASLRVGSFNCNGLGNPEKRRSVLGWLLAKPEDIIMVQESHSVVETEDFWRTIWGGDIYFNHGTSKSTGVTFLVKPNSNIKICSHRIITQGRVSLLEIEKDSIKYCLVNVYCPNSNDTYVVEKLFLETLGRTRDDYRILAGDWNTILNNNLDKYGGNSSHSNTKRQQYLNQETADHGISDIFRLRRGNERVYTHVNKQHKTQTRLDFFLIDDSLVNYPVCNADISHGFRSDHSYISLSLQGSPIKRGIGYWKLNNSHLNNESFLSNVREIINETADSNFDSYSGLWDVIKMKIKDFAIRFGKKEKKDKVAKKKKISSDIEEVKKITDFMQKDDLRKKLYDLESQLDGIIKAEVNGAMTRSRIQWTEEGERSTKYFFGLEKSRAKKKSITKLINSDQSVLRTQQDISEHVVNFYQEIFSSTNPNEHEITDYINSSNLDTIDQENADRLDRPISLLEMDSVISKFKKNKSPGWDGLTAEFYKVFWEDIKNILFNSFLESVDNGVMSPSQRLGIITLIPKPKTPIELNYIKNWRPITLLNVDYKIFTHIIKNRILSSLPTLISTAQSGFQKGKSTSDNLILMYLTLEHYHDNQEDTGMIMQVDLQRAFDSVEHKFLFSVLEGMGFGNYLINLVRVAFHAGMSYANVNGHLSSPVHILRGVHQGSPLSPILFLLVSQVLSNKLQYNPYIKGLSINGIDILMSLFADDTDLYLDPSQACVDAVILELNLFGQHSGCKPNISKTKCIPLGATRDNTSLRNYLTSTYGEDMVANEFTALGVKFDNTSSGADLCKMNYHSKLSNASSAINTWSKRDLTLIGKCTIIKSLILSQFTYLIIPLETPDTNTISKIDTMIFHFLWGCKRDKLKRDIVTSPRECGGLGLFYTNDFIIGLKVSLIGKVIDPNFQHAWKNIIINQLLHPNIPTVCIENCLTLKNTGFTFNLLRHYKLWKSISSQSSKSTVNHCVWGSDVITDIGSKFWNDILIDRNIIYLSDFVSEEGNLLSFQQFLRKWGQTSSIISSTQYASIKLGIRRFNNTNTFTSNITFIDTQLSLRFWGGRNTPNSRDTPLTIKGRNIRDTMSKRSDPSTLPPMRNWSANLSLTDIDWISIFTDIFTSFSNNFKLIQYQYKLLHRISTCRYMRYKMKIEKDSPNCSLCNHNLETISHIFIDCPATSSFLQGVNLFIRSNIDANYDDPYRHYLICLNHSDKSVNFINSVCCWFIGRSFQNKEPLFWERYLKHLKLFLLGEKPDIIRCLKDVIP